MIQMYMRAVPTYMSMSSGQPTVIVVGTSAISRGVCPIFNGVVFFEFRAIKGFPSIKMNGPIRLPRHRLSPSTVPARGPLDAVDVVIPLTVGEEFDSFQDFKAAIILESRENSGDGVKFENEGSLNNTRVWRGSLNNNLFLTRGKLNQKLIIPGSWSMQIHPHSPSLLVLSSSIPHTEYTPAYALLFFPVRERETR
ncbi:hypothetical protein BDD12DRAFT_978755 [Trichophaea hybrida]|nr:hypothetical protein BDD12DRAFT_978755 [Trichophaea hybrida]